VAFANVENRRAYLRRYTEQWRIKRGHVPIRDRPAVSIPDLPGEKWRPVAKFQDTYLVSSVGRIKRIKECARRATPSLLHPRNTGEGQYSRVTLFDGSKRREFTVHSLVVEAFYGPRPAGLVINHKNGIRTDNRLDNLEYCTQKENVANGIARGTIDPDKNGKAGILRRSVLRRLHRYLSIEQIAECYEVDAERIRKAVI
jgi:hypothetical protein